jgi:hypothetical protein
MSISDYRPRLSTELTPESYQRLSAILPHGWQKPLFQALVNGVITLYDKGGVHALGAIISNHIELELVAKNGLTTNLRRVLEEERED